MATVKGTLGQNVYGYIHTYIHAYIHMYGINAESIGEARKKLLVVAPPPPEPELLSTFEGTRAH
jgi:hypothetical protein